MFSDNVDPLTARRPTEDDTSNFDTRYSVRHSSFGRSSRRSSGATAVTNDDMQLERRFGLVNQFTRDFGPLSTFSFASSIISVSSCIASTIDTPFLLGGPSSVIWCWLIGSILNLSTALSIGEIISTYPTSGGLYSASAWLVPRKYRAVCGWVCGWLNNLGLIACTSSTEFAIARMIWSGITAATHGRVIPSPGMKFGLFAALSISHGCLNSLRTSHLAAITRAFVFINVAITAIITLVLFFLTPIHQMQPPELVFATVQNQTNAPNPLAFLFGLLSVNWTMTAYDSVAHISFEIQRPSVMAPSALFLAVGFTGILGFCLNVALCLAAPDIDQLPGVSGNCFLEILILRVGLTGALMLWFIVCLVGLFTVQVVLHANSRSVYAFASDRALPEIFSRMSPVTRTPLYAVWLVVFCSLLLGTLQFVSDQALEAVFSMCAASLDLSYVVPIICRQFFANHPDVAFHPGAFSLGKLSRPVNYVMISWTLFEVTILCLPTTYPLQAAKFNWSWVIVLSVLFLSLIWFWIYAHKVYTGPLRAAFTPNLDSKTNSPDDVFPIVRISPHHSFSLASGARHRFPSRDSIPLVHVSGLKVQLETIDQDGLSDASYTSEGDQGEAGSSSEDGEADDRDVSVTDPDVECGQRHFSMYEP